MFYFVSSEKLDCARKSSKGTRKSRNIAHGFGGTLTLRVFIFDKYNNRASKLIVGTVTYCLFTSS